MVVVPFGTAADRRREAPRVAEHLRVGGLIAYPTETVYGFGCALIPSALARLAALKGRDREKAFLLLISGPEQAPGLEWPRAALELAAAFWPGPLTLALRAEPGRYPDAVVGPGGTVAVRASPHPAVKAILGALGEPITSTSANLAGQPPARSAEEVRGVLAALGEPEEVWILDGGEALPPSPPSTIVDCSGRRPRVVRAGVVSIDELRKVVHDIDA